MKYIYQSFMALLLMTIICGVIYPLFIWAIGKTTFPYQANGSIIEHNGQAVGSLLIGQEFTQAKYFWSRPSATGNYPYNALASGGSNLGPLKPAFLTSVQQRSANLQKYNSSAAIPSDLVTASGSGLDPEISIAAAEYQAPRIALQRHLTTNQVEELIAQKSHYPILGFIGEARVNVLELNLALDNLATKEER